MAKHEEESSTDDRGFHKPTLSVATVLALVAGLGSYTASKTTTEAPDVAPTVRTEVKNSLEPLVKKQESDDAYIRALRLELTELRVKHEQTNGNIVKSLAEITEKLNAMAPKIYTDREIASIVDEKSQSLITLKKQMETMPNRADFESLRREMAALQTTLNVIALQRDGQTPTHAPSRRSSASESSDR